MKKRVFFWLVLGICGRLLFAETYSAASSVSDANPDAGEFSDPPLEFTWISTVNLAAWTNASSWAGDVAPSPAGSHSVTLTNRTGALYTSRIHEDWTLHRLAFTGGGGDFRVEGSNRTIRVGPGGIHADRTAGTEQYFILSPRIVFTADDVGIGRTDGASGSSIQVANTLDSSVSGGTKVRAQTGFNDGHLNFNANGGYIAKSSTNVFWYLENSRFAIYTLNLTDALGSNTLKVTGGSFAAASNTQARSHTIGCYSTNAGDVATFDTPIEVDGKTIGHSSANSALRPWTIIGQRGHASATGMMRTRFRGKWASTEALTNTLGDGVLQVDGVANNTNRQNWFQQDGSNYTGRPITSEGWNGDVAFNSGYNVIAAPNAFGPGNNLVLNLKNANGTQTPMSNVWLLATHGNDVSGRVRVYGGNVVSNAPGMAAGQIRKGRATMGIEGTGTVTFSGLIGLSRMCDQVAARNANPAYDGYFYATPGGTARFTGGIVENDIGVRPGVTTNAPALFVRGGGTVVLTNGAATHTNTTRVLENTTLQLDNALPQSRLTIEAGSTLQGGGTIGAPVSVSGVLAPGPGLGTLTTSNGVTFSGASAELRVELSTAEAASGRLASAGVLNLGTSTALRLLGGRAGTTYTIATYGSRTGTFASIHTNGLTSGLYLEPDDLVYGPTSLTVRLRSSTQFVLTYRAGGGGTLSGHLSQSVDPGGDGTPVAATPDKNFRFAAWSDGSTQNPRTDTNAWSSLTVTSRFEASPGFFSLLYTAGANGSLSGQTAQAVLPGGSGARVTALPYLGYRFSQWSDGLTANPRADANVSSNVAVTALFTIESYTLKYSAGPGGRITGTTPQSVPHGGSGTPVTPTPHSNFLFTAWSDGSTATPRTDAGVTQALSVTASFAPAPGFVSLIYTAGAGGRLTGDTAQAVPMGGTGTPVTAVPHIGYRFVRWSDNSTVTPRTDTTVTVNLAISAIFELEPTPEPPTFVTRLLTEPAIPHPAEPFVQVYVMPARDSWPLYGFRTHGRMTQAHWESVFRHIGHLSVCSLVNPYYPSVGGEPWDNGYDSLLGYLAAEALGRPTAGGVAKLPENATEEGRIRALYADPHGLNMKYFFHDSEEEMIDQVPGGSGDGRLRGTTWAVNWTNEASMRTAASSDFNCATNGRMRSFSLSFGLFAGYDMYGTWPHPRLVAVGTTTNGWQIEFKSTGSKGSNTVRFITYKNGVENIAESPSWTYVDAGYWRTVTVTAATNPGDPSKLDVEVKVAPVGDDKIYARTTTVNRPNAYADSSLYLLTTRAQSTARMMRDLDDFVLRDFTGETIVAYDFEPETPGPILETLPIRTVPDRSGHGHALAAPPGAELNFTRHPTHGIRPELKALISQWLVDELLAARAAAGRPPPELIDNWRISETPGRLAVWLEEGFTHGSGSEAYWLNPTLAAGENKVISLVRRGSPPTRFAWTDGSDWSQLWLGTEHNTNVLAAAEYDDLVALQVLQGVRWFIVFTAMSNGHLAEYTLESDPASVAVFNAEAVYNTCQVASWYQPTSATLADSALTAEKYGDPAIGADTLYIRRDNAATKEAWFAAIKVAGTGSYAVALPSQTGLIRNLRTGVETEITNGVFHLPLSSSVDPHHFLTRHAVAYVAGPGGQVSGAAAQAIAHGGTGTAVQAVADTGYHFVNWSDGSTQNPRTDLAVTNALTALANFAINTYTLNYTAGAGGSIRGASPQTVNHGANGAPVEAVPNPGYRFTKWSDHSTQNPRTEFHVTGPLSVAADFDPHAVLSISSLEGMLHLSWDVSDIGWVLEQAPGWTPIPPADYLTNGTRVLYVAPVPDDMRWFRLSAP